MHTKTRHMAKIRYDLFHPQRIIPYTYQQRRIMAMETMTSSTPVAITSLLHLQGSMHVENLAENSSKHILRITRQITQTRPIKTSRMVSYHMGLTAKAKPTWVCRIPTTHMLVIKDTMMATLVMVVMVDAMEKGEVETPRM